MKKTCVFERDPGFSRPEVGSKVIADFEAYSIRPSEAYKQARDIHFRKYEGSLNTKTFKLKEGGVSAEIQELVCPCIYRISDRFMRAGNLLLNFSLKSQNLTFKVAF